MRQFLLASCPAAIWVIFILEIGILILFIKDFIASKNTLILFSALITMGLCIDALGISLGSVMLDTPLFIVSRIRFISHGILIPLLLPICAYALGFKKQWKTFTLVITIILMIAGLAAALATKLEISEIANVVRYKASNETPMWASTISGLLNYGTVILLIITGIAVWIKQRTPFLFLSGFFMFIFSAIGPASGNTDLIFYISMYGELLMVLFLYLYSRNRMKHQNA